MSAEDEGHRQEVEEARQVTGMRAGTFLRWRDPTCPHAPAHQMPDGDGTLCLDCGVLRVRVRA